MAEERVYSEQEIIEKLKAELPAWELRDGWIRRKFKTPGWPHTLMLVNAIGFAAEAAWHHPDLAVSWGELTVKLQTHRAGGVTDCDFELAHRIEELATWQPDEASALPSFERGFKKKWMR